MYHIIKIRYNGCLIHKEELLLCTKIGIYAFYVLVKVVGHGCCGLTHSCNGAQQWCLVGRYSGGSVEGVFPLRGDPCGCSGHEGPKERRQKKLQHQRNRQHHHHRLRDPGGRRSMYDDRGPGSDRGICRRARRVLFRQKCRIEEKNSKTG